LTERKLQKFIQSQHDYRKRMIERLARRHGNRTVYLAVRHLDELSGKYPPGLSGLPGYCRELRERRGSSRSWSLAADMMIELLKVLADALDQLPRRDRNRVPQVVHIELPTRGLTRSEKPETVDL
jgi:hypothetical protein